MPCDGSEQAGGLPEPHSPPRLLPPLPPLTHPPGLPLQILWAFCVYLEAVSVLPQLRMMQKAKVVEKFTAHYVFALGLSRFISCAHWILQVLSRAGGGGRGPGGTFMQRLRPSFTPPPAAMHTRFPSRRSWMATSTFGRRWAAVCGP